MKYEVWTIDFLTRKMYLHKIYLRVSAKTFPGKPDVHLDSWARRTVGSLNLEKLWPILRYTHRNYHPFKAQKR